MVKVLGLPRAGTNYLRWLLEHNFEVTTNKALGWEHGLPDMRLRNVKQPMEQTILEATAGLKRIVIYKERDHWLASVKRNSPVSEQMILTFHATTPPLLYDHFHAAWAPHAHFIRYESFIQDFTSALNYLGTLIGVEPHSYTTPRTVPESPHWRSHHRRRYL
jgi:hypothetical protein